jgi:hypothetical protein
MTLDAAGDLGIGVTDPTAKVHAYSSAGAIVGKFDSNQSGGATIGIYGSGTINGYFGTSGHWLGNTATDIAIIAETSKAVTFFTGGSATERARITSDGNFNLGANAFTARMNVYSATNEITQYVENARNTSSGDRTAQFVLGANADNTSSYFLQCITAGVGGRFYIYGNGTYGTISDRNLKKNIETTRDGYLNDLMRLRVVKYNWNTDADGTPKELGWIAQELAEVFPGMVQDSLPDADGNTLKEVKTSVLPFMLLKAIQEQQAIIESLKARLDAANL